MGTLSGERKGKHRPIRDRRAAGCRVDSRPSPLIPAGFRRGRRSIFFLPILLGAGGRQQVGNISRSNEFGEHLYLQRIR